MLISRRTLLAATPALCIARSATASESGIVLEVLYSSAYVLKDTMEEIRRRFLARYPSVGIKLSTLKNYTEMMQATLRAEVVGGLPDIAFQGLNFVSLLAERGAAIALDGFIGDEASWKADGFTEQMLSLGADAGKTYAIPFALSLPTIFYNGELVRKAGGDPDNFPTAWPEIVKLASKIEAPSGGIYFDYTPTGNWTFIALVTSQGGHMATPDGRTVAFDGPEGLEALTILREIGEAHFTDMSRDQAKQAFAAGSVGMLVTSSSDTDFYEAVAAGRFPVRVAPFPVSAGGSLPAGGNGAMIHATDPARQKLAWEFVKFATGSEAQALVATRTGYLPGNERVLENDTVRQFYKAHPNLRVAAQQLSVADRWFSFPAENSAKIVKLIEDEMRDVLLLRVEPRDALSRMSANVQALLG